RILDMPHVQEHLTKARAAIAAKLDVSKERTLMEISRLAFSDIRKLFNEDGTLKKPHEYDGETAAFVSSIECDELFDGVGEAKIWTGYNKKVKLWDKVRALEMLAKHYGILKDDDPTDVKFNVIISGAGNKP
ncbi:MAG: terminase small subunit, partial [Bacteroidota bacterium]|nr:terminase small subunit [Bacteroidota bacterium]